MLEYVSIIDPTPHINGVWNILFPSHDEIILSKEEKNIIVDQINDVTSHLNDAKRHIDDENFEDAIKEVSFAIEVSTCGKCKKKMLVAAYDIDHASNVCNIDGERCETIKDEIDAEIVEFIENYLPRVEEVLSAKEE